jgi:hypothetical protein
MRGGLGLLAGRGEAVRAIFVARVVNLREHAGNGPAAVRLDAQLVLALDKTNVALFPPILALRQKEMGDEDEDEDGDEDGDEDEDENEEEKDVSEKSIFLVLVFVLVYVLCLCLCLCLCL